MTSSASLAHVMAFEHNRDLLRAAERSRHVPRRARQARLFKRH